MSMPAAAHASTCIRQALAMTAQAMTAHYWMAARHNSGTHNKQTSNEIYSSLGLQQALNSVAGQHNWVLQAPEGDDDNGD
jgi:hypothetical protein